MLKTLCKAGESYRCSYPKHDLYSLSKSLFLSKGDLIYYILLKPLGLITALELLLLKSAASSSVSFSAY